MTDAPDAPRPHLMRPKTVSVCEEEAGSWESLGSFNARRCGQPKSVHAILFEDGTVWDAVNGWRDTRLCVHCNGNGRIP